MVNDSTDFFETELVVHEDPAEAGPSKKKNKKKKSKGKKPMITHLIEAEMGPLTAAEKDEPYIPLWSLKRRDMLENKTNCREFLNHAITNVDRSYHRALGTLSLGNLYAISLCDTLVKGVEVLERMERAECSSDVCCLILIS